uniref:Uncharacterized protein n=1 Tax=Knipowitschia caucasica TaxID=637954 RepID=A0AAV2LBZ8_KNICA
MRENPIKAGSEDGVGRKQTDTGYKTSKAPFQANLVRVPRAHLPERALNRIRSAQGGSVEDAEPGQAKNQEQGRGEEHQDTRRGSVKGKAKCQQ